MSSSSETSEKGLFFCSSSVCSQEGFDRQVVTLCPGLWQCAQDVKTSHALCWGTRCGVGTPSSQIVAPAYVALSLQAEVVILEFLWTILFCSGNLSSLVRVVASFWSRCRFRLRSWLLRNTLSNRGRQGKHKHCNPGVSCKLPELLVDCRDIVVGLQ